MNTTDVFEKAGERDGVARFLMKKNGLEVLLKEDHAAPVATFLVLYRVGSRNEAVGYTGSTHMLEHMLFKGTPTFNRDKGTQIAAELERVGADFNATTWYDRTKYFETVPSDQIEFAVRLEADRMRNSFIKDEDRQSEMTVVRNELEIGENDPATVLDTHLLATIFREHPYHHPTIGWRSDVEGVPTERLKLFYDTFYWPNNATVVAAGDFDPEALLALIDTHFGAIPASPEPIPDVYTVEPPQEGERRITLRRAGQDGIVTVAFRTPESASPDTAVLAVIDSILSSGRSSRLYRDLVDMQRASDVATWAGQMRDPMMFQLTARLLPGVEHGEIEASLLAAAARLRDEPVPEAELEKAKRIVETQLVFEREGTADFAERLSEAVSRVDWNWFFDYPAAVAAVTAEDVQRVARTYFRRNQMTAAWFVPLAGDEDDGLALTGAAAGAGASAGPSSPRSASAPASLDVAPFASASPLRAPAHYLPAERRRRARGGGSGPAEDEGENGTAAGGSLGSARFAERTTRVVFDNGATVLALENHADPTVAIVATVRAGSYYAPEGRRVLADLTARMLQRGTRRRDALQFATDVESLGIQLHVGSDAFSVEAESRALSRDVWTALEAIAEMLREPAFPEEELEKVKTQAAARIRLAQESTDDRSFARLTQIVLDPSSPYYRPPAEEVLAAIDAITAEDIRQYYEEHFGGGALTLAVVGDVDAAAVVERARSLFGGWSGARPGGVRPAPVEAETRSLTPPAREFVLVKDKSTAGVIIGQPSRLKRRDDDYFASAVANAAIGQSTLSSRLGIRVRDREGLTYGIGSRFYGASLVDGLWYARVSAAPENVDKAIASTLDELEIALRDGITDAEVAGYKSNFAGSFKVSLATNAGVAERLAEAEFYGFGPSYLDDFPRLVAAVTTEDANAALRRHLVPENLVIVVAGDMGGE